MKTFKSIFIKVISAVLIFLIISFLRIPKAYASDVFPTIYTSNLWLEIRGGGSNATFLSNKTGSGVGPQDTNFAVSSFNTSGVPFDYYNYIRMGVGMNYQPTGNNSFYKDIINYNFNNITVVKDSVRFNAWQYGGSESVPIINSIEYGDCTPIANFQSAVCSSLTVSLQYSWKGGDYVELWLNSNDLRLSPDSTVSYHNYSFTSTTDNSDTIVNQNQTIINQNNQINNSINEVNNGVNNINDSINNDNVDEANNSASSFFDSFNSDDRGLSDLLIAPIQLLQNISNATCTNLTFPLPFVNQNVVLPCMSTIYNKFPVFLSLWQLITTGLISYNIGLNFFKKIKDLSNPQNDKVEVLNL